MYRLVVTLCLALVTALAGSPATAEPSKSECEGLMKALAEAQGAYNRALTAWKQATVKTIQAEAAVAEIDGKLKKNDRLIIAKTSELAAAEADQAACEAAAGGGPLAPLVDCSKVPGRISKAKKEIADLEAANEALEEERASRQQVVAQREEEQAAAHAAERQAWAALEAAKKAAAGCHLSV